jgi:uncharacterized membrane protein YfcA
MNPIFFVLGIPCGIMAGFIGRKLSKKVKNSWLKALVDVTPLTMLITVVVIIDLIF